MTDKYFHVACVIKEGHLHDLLTSMEQHKIGNLEVRAVAPMLALPPPDSGKRRYTKRNKAGHVASGQVRDKVSEAMKVGEPINVSQLARKLNLHPGSVNSVVQTMTVKKLAKKVSPGTFVRVKVEGQVNGNGAHAS